MPRSIDSCPPRQNFEVHQFSHQSTGFTRYRTTNLLDDTREKIDRQPIDVAVISFGANDTQGIYLDGEGSAYMSPRWQQIVTERVTAIVNLLRQRGIAVYWVGLPRMREADFEGQIAQMNAFYAERMRQLNVPFIETVSSTVDANGRYSPYLRNPDTGEQFNARANDGIHMTMTGYGVLTSGLAERIKRSVAEARAQAGLPAQQQAAAPPRPAAPSPSRPANTAAPSPAPPRPANVAAPRPGNTAAPRPAATTPARPANTAAPRPAPAARPASREQSGGAQLMALASALAVALAAAPPALPVAAAMQGVNCASSTLCEGGTLPAFLAKLHFANRSGAPIHILQIGDSHTAGDMITNGYRTRLQARYGNGGRGVLAAGRPYAGYITFGVTASESAGWTTNVIYGNRYNASGPAMGVSGFTRFTRGSGQTLGVSADTPDYAFDRVIVCALLRPGAGTISVRMGGQELVWPLDAAVPGAACRSLESSGMSSNASITTLDNNPVSITSFGTFHRRGGGVVVSNVGVVGAQLVHFGRTDDDVVRHEIAAYRPDLVVLAYGTNEGFGARGTRASMNPCCAARSRASAGWPAPMCRSCCWARPMPPAIMPGSARAAARAGTRRASWAKCARFSAVSRASFASAIGIGSRRWAAAAPPRRGCPRA